MKNQSRMKLGTATRRARMSSGRHVARPLLTLALSAVVLSQTSAARADQHVNANAHQWWKLGAEAWSIDQSIVVEQTSDACYFALVVFYSGVSSGAYMGLQQLTDGSHLSRFSVWDSTAATPASGATCKDFGGEGVGKTCELPFAFEVGHPYTMRMWRLDADSEGVWWGAWLIDEVTKVETQIGSIRAPSGAGDITVADTFDEYWGTAVPCDAVPYSSGRVSAPKLNGGAAVATASSSSVGACSGGKVTALTGGQVRLELGAPPGDPDGGQDAGPDVVSDAEAIDSAADVAWDAEHDAADVAWDAEHDAADVAWDAEQDATPAGAGASWPDEDGGCGCRVQGRPESRPALETFAALLGAFILRRVRRRRGASESPRS